MQIKQYLIDFSDPSATSHSIMFWVAIALVFAYVIIAAVAKNKRSIVNKSFFVLGALYVAVAVVLFSLFTAKENSADGGVNPLSLYPMLAFALVVLISAFVFAFSKNKDLHRAFLGFTLLALEIVVICLVVYYITGESMERNYLTEQDVNVPFLWLAAGALGAFVLALSFTDKKPLVFDARSTTYAGISVALAFALSYIRIIKMPMGGALTLASLLPIMLYSYMFGVRKGVVVGIVFGVLQAIQDPWILHPAQFLLDYPIAFAGIGLAGILRNTKLNPRVSFLLGGVIAMLFRLGAHFLSGVFAFGSFAYYYDMTSPYLYSIVYNATFVLPDALLAIIVGELMMISRPVLSLVLKAGEQKGARKKKVGAQEKTPQAEE